MKRIFPLLIAAITLVSIGSVASASFPMNNLAQAQMLSASIDKASVTQAIQTNKPKSFLVKYKDDLGRKELRTLADPNALSYEHPYRVVIANRDIVSALVYGNSLALPLSRASYYWEVPVLYRGRAVASVTVDKMNGQWQVVEVGGYLPANQISISSDPSAITALFQKFGIGSGDNFVHLRIPSLHIDFLYLNDGGLEYFVPIIHGDNSLAQAYGLRTGALYNRQQIVAAVGPALQAGLDANQTGLLGGGGPSVTPGNNSRDADYLLMGLGILVLTAGGWGVLRRKAVVKE